MANLKNQDNLLQLAVLRLLAFVFFRQNLVSRIALVIGLGYWRELAFVAVIYWILAIEAVIFAVGYFLGTANYVAFQFQSFMHRIAPFYYNVPKPFTELNHFTNLTNTAFVTKTVIPLYESRGEADTIEADFEVVSPYISEPLKIAFLKDNTFKVNDEILTKAKAQNRLSASKSSLNPQKPSAKTLANIDKWERVLAEMERLENEQKSMVNIEFKEHLNAQFSTKNTK